MIVSINDETVEVTDRTTVAALLESLGFPDKGIAIAVNWAVIRDRIGTPPQTRCAGGIGHGVQGG